MSGAARVSIVLLTHNRASEVERTLTRLLQLPDRAPLIVVDNGSSDGTAARIEANFPQVELVRCPRNLGAAGRNAGVERVRTPHVAFCDDDTWWAPGALTRAAELLDAHPRLAAVGAKVLVGPQRRLDPACARMACSPLDGEGLPGRRLIAFMAGAVVMRAAAFREVGGYEARFFLGAEEALMALDLAAKGWRMIYADDLITHHHPSPNRDPMQRSIAVVRNRLWVAWMRLPFGDAWGETFRLLRDAANKGHLAASAAAAFAGLGWALRRRRVVPRDVQAMWRQAFRKSVVVRPLPPGSV